MLKKDGRIRIYVDYHDLNKTCLKDDVLLSYIDVLVDNIASHSLVLFMDGFFGYKQVKMAPEDKHTVTFVKH